MPVQVAWIEVESKLLAVVQRLQSHLGGVNIEGDFRRMDLESEVHVSGLEGVEVEVALVVSRWRPHAKHAVFGVINELAALRHKLRDQFRNPDSQVHVGTVGNVLGAALGHLGPGPSHDFRRCGHGWITLVWLGLLDVGHG